MKDWQEDLKKELGIDAIVLDKGTKNNMKLVEEHHQAYVINFESAWRCINLLTYVDKDTTILIDESHKIKNISSKIYKFCDKLRLKTPYKMILTGTPQSNGYIDYYSQLKFTDTLKMTHKDFCDKYCVYQTMNYTGFPFKQLIGYKHEDELDALIKSNCVFCERTLDNELIPSNVDIKFPIPSKYKHFKRHRVYEDYAADNVSKLFVTLREMCSGYIGPYNVGCDKLQWVSDLLSDVNDRVVIYYNFNNERDELIKLCDKLKIPYSEYNGRVKDLTNFKNNKNGVALCQYISGSTGINDLVISYICVMYSPPLSYINFEQAKKRIDRIGQTKKPLYYYLYCTGTVEEDIYESLKSGKDFDEKLFRMDVNE